MCTVEVSNIAEMCCRKELPAAQRSTGYATFCM